MSEHNRKRLEELREKARLGGGKDRVKAQHEKGKFTARERLARDSRCLM